MVVLHKNELIDAFDQLNSGGDTNEVWDAAHDLVANIGGKHIVCANLHNASGSILWFRTSMRSDWINRYLEEDFLTVDPILIALNGITGDFAWDAGTHDFNIKVPKRTFELSRCLRDCGYKTLMSHSFKSNHTGSSEFVTICFDQDYSDEKEIDHSKVKSLQSLLSYFVNKPPNWDDEGLVNYGAFSLSPRERDVLSLLANGYQTARIAEKLNISEAMVSKHFSKCRKKLNAATREQALALAMAAGAINL